jgi:hypothetical protein
MASALASGVASAWVYLAGSASASAFQSVWE